MSTKLAVESAIDITDYTDYEALRFACVVAAACTEEEEQPLLRADESLDAMSDEGEGDPVGDELQGGCMEDDPEQPPVVRFANSLGLYRTGYGRLPTMPTDAQFEAMYQQYMYLGGP